MRDKVKVLLLILVMIFSVDYVRAEATSCDNLSVSANPGEFYTNTQVVMYYKNEGTNHSYSYSLYQLSDGSDRFVAYCRNAGKCATNTCKTNESSTHRFDCDKTVFDPTVEASTPAKRSSKAYEKGIIEILQKGYKAGSTDYQKYIASNIALRTYEMLWVVENSNGSSADWRLNKAMRYYTNLWLKDTAVKNKLAEISRILGSSAYIRQSEYYAATVTSWNEDPKLTEEIKNQTYDLIIAALDASIDYLNNGSASITWNSKPLKVKSPVETDGDVKKYKVAYTYTFDIQKFDSSESSVKMDFDCLNCQGLGVNYKLYVNDTQVSSLSNLEFVDYTTNGTGKVNVTIEFEATSETYHCEELQYTIDLKYFDDTISTEAYVMQDADCPTCQLFYMLYAENVEKNDSIKEGVELCTVSCKEAEEQCLNDKIESACNIYYDRYGGNCAECTTYIGNATCSEEDSKINISEGYDVDTANCGTIDENNLNVLQCVIHNEDPAGNSYKATTTGFEKVQENTNDYCTVWCKEDYYFTLPGIKEANSGRYFSLEASVEGKKSCYTSMIDEYDTFESDLEEARQNVIKAYNNWLLYYTATYSHGSNKISNPQSGATHSSHFYNCDDPCPEEGSCHCDYCSGDTARDYYGYSYEFEFTAYEPTSKSKSNLSSEATLSEVSNTSCDIIEGKVKCTYDDSGKTWCYHGSCDSEDGEDISTYYNATTVNQKAIELNSAISAYAKLVNQYNSCYGESTYSYDQLTLDEDSTQGWKMSYNYDPTISFWYEESYMNSVITDKLETKGNISIGSFTENHYSGSNGKVPTGNVSQKFIAINSGTNFICYQSGSSYTCGNVNVQVGTAKYVRQEMESSGSYITPTQFYTIYPTGAIVVAEEDKEDEIENSSELTNLLPVGLGTTQGVYTYALIVKNLGEYYNKTDLGRLWDYENNRSVVATVLEEAEEGNSCIKEGALNSSVKVNDTVLVNGVYVCAYKVNCPDCPVECDPSCENPDCPDNKCPVECDNCVVTNNETNVGYRPITPGDINPNDRDLGVNWKYDENSISTALELKAYATTKEIEEAGETIYDIDFEDAANIDEFAIEFTLDSEMITKIREYNDRYENNDGYANNSLKCYDHTNSNDGKVYKNVYCYSTFIDELLYDNKTADKVKITGNRIIGNNADDTDNRRKAQTQTSGYWTTWSEANSNSWTITTQNGIAYYKQNYAEIGIGPSWK